MSKKSSSESEQTDQQHAHLKRSRHDATLMKAGPPTVYRLNTNPTQENRAIRNVRQLTYGRRDKNKENKVILMVGETGAGKTTLINTLTNYLLGVKFEDQEFYQITDEDEETEEATSQTSEITVYEVFDEENPTSLTIIDTPGYGDTEGLKKEISECLSRLFSHKDEGIHYIDLLCFVMKATQNRFTEKERNICHSVLSLFGRDIENNIVVMFTHSGGGPPTGALNAIEKAEIPCRRDEDNQPIHFLFNNRQKEKRDKKYERALSSSWELGEESLNEFFTLLKEKNRKSVKMTLDVVTEQIQTEACVSDLKEIIDEKEVQTEELIEIKEAPKQNRNSIQKCENQQATMKGKGKKKESNSKKKTKEKKKKATICKGCLMS